MFPNQIPLKPLVIERFNRMENKISTVRLLNDVLKNLPCGQKINKTGHQHWNHSNIGDLFATIRTYPVTVRFPTPATLVGLIVGQATGIFLVNIWMLLGLGVILALLAWGLMRSSFRKFTYEALLR